MPQRVAGNVFAYIALPECGLETALHGAGCDGRGALPGWEKPFLGPVLEPIGAQLEKAFDVRCMESFLRLIKNEAVISLEDGMPITLKELIDRDGYFVADGQSELLRTLFLQENVNEYVRVLSKSTYKNKEPFELSVGQRGTFYVCLNPTTPFKVEKCNNV